MLDKVINILKRVLEDEQVNVDTSVENNEKWDSMAQLSIAVELEEAFGISLDPDQIAELKSVKAIMDIINGLKF